MIGRSHTRRGFSLTELAISVAVAGITTSMVVMIVVSQQRSLQSTEMQRGSGEAGRDALLEMERTLRRAGFGVDPRFAFDFNSFRCPTSEQVTAMGSRTACRDRTDSPDRIVFIARNPYYRIDANGTNGCTTSTGCPTGLAWTVTGKSTTPSAPTLSVTLRAGQRIEMGQTLLVACSGGARFTMSTVSTAASTSTDSNVILRLYPTSSTNPYFENGFADSCYDAGATAFVVDRYAYSIRTLGGTPWLVLDMGLDLDRDGRDPWAAVDDDDLLPIAPYIEDMQIAYVFDRASGRVGADSNRDYATGNDRTSTLAEEPDPAANGPVYATPENDDRRGTLHPANIRAIRVGLVLRSSRPDMSVGKAGAAVTHGGTVSRGWVGDPLPQLENASRALSAAELGFYRRQTAITTIAVRNLTSRGMFTF